MHIVRHTRDFKDKQYVITHHITRTCVEKDAGECQETPVLFLPYRKVCRL